jgi:hypothetical protein
MLLTSTLWARTSLLITNREFSKACNLAITVAASTPSLIGFHMKKLHLL